MNLHWYACATWLQSRLLAEGGRLSWVATVMNGTFGETTEAWPWPLWARYASSFARALNAVVGGEKVGGTHEEVVMALFGRARLHLEPPHNHPHAPLRSHSLCRRCTRVPHRAQRRGVARLLHLQHGHPRQLDEPTGGVRPGQDRPRRCLLPPCGNLARSQPARQGTPPASLPASLAPPLCWSSHPGLTSVLLAPSPPRSLCPLPSPHPLSSTPRTPHSLPLAIDRSTWST